VSALRLLGLLGGGLFLIWTLRALRRSGPRSALAPLTALTGVVLIGLSLAPGIAGVASGLLDLGDLRGSRLITVLLFAVAALWIGFLLLLGRLSRTQAEMDALIRATVLQGVEARAPPPEPGAVLCVIPALNEARNIPDVLAHMPKVLHGVPVHTLVVDDGSTDGTAAAAARCGALVAAVPMNRGQGAALRVGFDAATRWRAGCAVTLDADGQNSPKEMAELVAPVLDGAADVVIGSRILGVHHKTNWWRHLGVLFFNRVFNVLMDTSITDISSGYRAVRPDLVQTLPLRQDQYSAAEFLVLAAKRGARIVERPITFHRRASGRSKKGPEVLYGLRFAYVLLRSWLRPL
jgi:hypothetical protein